APRVANMDKKHLKIQPDRNATKPVYCYLLIHPDWLKGSPGTIEGTPLGGYADAAVAATARWFAERLKNLKLIEVRGRIRLVEDTTIPGVGNGATVVEEVIDKEEAAKDEKTIEADADGE